MLTNITTTAVDDPTNNRVNITFKAEIDQAALRAHVAAIVGDDGLGDPTTSKGLQQVVYMDGRFAIMSYHDALYALSTDVDAVTMIDVAALRAALRTALN